MRPTTAVVALTLALASFAAPLPARADHTPDDVACPVTRCVGANDLAMGNFDDLVEDPGFERASASPRAWTQTGSGNLWVLAADPGARTGNRSARRDGTGAPTIRVLTNALQAEARPGDPFAAEAYLRSDGADGIATLVVQWLNGSGVQIAVLSASTTPTAGAWRRVTRSGPAPAGTAFARVRLIVSSHATGTWRADDVYLSRQTTSFSLAPGAVGADKLSFDPATQAELNAHNHDARYVKLGGNAGTGTLSMGTTDAAPFELKVGGTRALRVEPTDTGEPNLIGGLAANSVLAGVRGATVLGGQLDFPNRANDNFATVGGGNNNTAGGDGGPLDTYITIGGGGSNRAEGFLATVGGGGLNFSHGDSATIGGGSNNTAFLGSTVAGGLSNFASERSAVGGGELNRAGGDRSVVAGGYGNSIAPAYGTAPGGAGSAIGGGASNAVDETAAYASIGGGSGNSVSGPFAVVPGGQEAAATHYGQLAHASGMFAARGDAQASEYVLRVESEGTLETMWLDRGMSEGLTVPQDATWAFEALVVGRGERVTDASGTHAKSAAYRITGVVENVRGTTTLLGTPVVEVLAEDTPTFDAWVGADDASDMLLVQISGQGVSHSRWVATVRTTEVSF